MHSPRTAAEAALAETLAAVERLNATVAALPTNLHTALSPTLERIDVAVRDAAAAARRSDQAAAVPVGRTLAVQHAQQDESPRRISSAHDVAARYGTIHVVIAAAMGLIGGLLIAATLNLRIPGLSG